MDVVLRTPHGEGEISLVADSSNVTLGDVVERVVGHPAPPVVYVDGRAASANTFLSEAGVVIGSLIDTDDAAFDAAHDAPVELWQLAGHGCGTTAPLLPGDYRIGPGRRIHANELAMAPVDDAVIELRVGEDGRVRVRDRGGVELIGGPSASSDHFVEWADEPLAVDGRVFTLLRPADPGVSAAEARIGEPVVRRSTAAGTITFHRPSDSDPSAEQRGASLGPIDALALARTHSAQLWRHRAIGPGELRLPLGLHITDSSGRQSGDHPGAPHVPPTNGTGEGRRLQTVEAVLDEGRGLAFVGRADFTRSAASGLLVLATTMYGPADLEVVVTTTPDRADSWEWAKWLPHSRIDGRPNVIVNDPQLRSWLRRRRSQWASSPSTARRTLMVVDDENAWHERTSPLREIIADEHAPISFVVLTTHLHDVPTLCETVMSERSHGTAHVELRNRRRRYDDVHAFVVSADLAAEVARRLAPLDDAAIAPAPDDRSADRLSIEEFHGWGSDPRPTIAHRWNIAVADHPAEAGGVRLNLGLTPASPTRPDSGGIVSVDLATHGPHLLVVEPDILSDRIDVEGRAVVDSALIGVCVDHPPDELEIVLLSGGVASPVLARLPHVSTNLGNLDPHRLRRALRSLQAEQRRRHTILERSGVDNIAALHGQRDRSTLRRLVVIVDRLDAASQNGLEDLRPILEIGSDVGIHVVVRTAETVAANDAVLALFGSTVTARDSPPGSPDGGIGSTNRPPMPSRHPKLRVGGGLPVGFVPPTMTADDDDDAASVDGNVDSGGLSIRPFVVARELTPMEKRLVGSEFGSNSPPPVEARSVYSSAVLDVLDALDAEAPSRSHDEPAPIADELPDHLDLIDFLREHPGDSIPFALADAPDQQGHTPIWWLPGGDSSMVAYGVARSRVSALIPALAVGAATRLGVADVTFHVLCTETTALEPLAQLPHTASVTSARAHAPVESLIDELHAEVDRRLRLVRSDVSAARIAAAETSIVVLIDDVGGCRRLLDGADRDLWAEFEHLLVRGQPVGICAVLIARRTDEISARLAATIDTHLVAQLAANDDERRFDLEEGGTASANVPGRARRAADGIDLQFATLSADLRSVIAEHIAAGNDRERR